MPDDMFSITQAEMLEKIPFRTNELPLRKHAYSNILNILPPKNENFQIKILIFFKFLLKT